MEESAYFQNIFSRRLLAGFLFRLKPPYLGIGNAVETPVRFNLRRQNVVLLMSDGARTPLNPYLLQKAAASVAMNH